jgi:hypothetical protein
MRLKTKLAHLWHKVTDCLQYRTTHGPWPNWPNYRYTLPRGVRCCTEAEGDAHRAAWKTLPVLGELSTYSDDFSQVFFGNMLFHRIGAALYDRLIIERDVFLVEHCRDFSCGIAVIVTRSGDSNHYEPYDLDQKLSDHLAAFLNKHGVSP